MKLKIEISGHLERIIVTSMPQRFIHKVFRHCLGKNNTPYFANNCFKGVLYFDYEMAAKFAQAVNFPWSTWKEAKAIHQTQGYLFEQHLDITCRLDHGPRTPLAFTALETETRAVELDSALAALGPDEICILLGSVDKGSESFELEIEAPFDAGKLLVSLHSLENYKMQDLLITGMRYDGRAMQAVPGKHVGKNMVSPVLFAKDGRELDLYDFMGQDDLDL